MQAKPLATGETLAYQTRSFVIRLQRVRPDTWTVTTERAGFRVDELARTFATESDARDLAREISKRLRDGATVDEVLAAIQPAADVIAAATALLVLDADVRKLSKPQRDAIAAANPAGHIARRQVGTVKTLYALRDMHLGDLICRGFTPLRLELNARGLAMRDHILTHRTTIAA